MRIITTSASYTTTFGDDFGFIHEIHQHGHYLELQLLTFLKKAVRHANQEVRAHRC
jgi:hypothetical protein